MAGLAGKTAIVTGGGSGIGEATAVALARAGAAVAICGRRQASLERVAAAIEAEGGRALAVAGDVSSPEDVARIVAAALEAFGGVHILVNNAGIGEGGDYVHAQSLDGWEQVMGVNLRGPLLMTQAVLPLMRTQRAGEIINISSESGLEYYEGDTAYTVSKHALNTLGELTQRENQAYGIRVNTICPGMVWTEMTEASARLDRARCLEPEDIADLVLWLVTRRPNIKIGRPILIQTMLDPWEAS